MPSLKGVNENVVAGLIVLGLAWLGSLFIHASVPLWLVPAAALLSGAVAFLAGKAARRTTTLLGYQAELLGEAMLSLNKIIAGKLPGIDFEKFVENGVLAPAQFGLTLRKNEKIRTSVLRWNEARQSFDMLYESGYTVGRKNDFTLSKVSMAGHALQSGNLEWSDDVFADQRWNKHPQANPSHQYHSLAVAPIQVDGDTVAILSVVSSEKGAFCKGDLTFIELLATFLGVAWALTDDADQSGRVTDTDEEGKTPESEGAA